MHNTTFSDEILIELKKDVQEIIYLCFRRNLGADLANLIANEFVEEVSLSHKLDNLRFVDLLRKCIAKHCPDTKILNSGDSLNCASREVHKIIYFRFLRSPLPENTSNEIEDILNEFGEDLIYFERARKYIKDSLGQGFATDCGDDLPNCLKNRNFFKKETRENLQRLFERCDELVKRYVNEYLI